MRDKTLRRLATSLAAVGTLGLGVVGGAGAVDVSPASTQHGEVAVSQLVAASNSGDVMAQTYDYVWG
jgi:hypothetical protein